MKIQDSLHQVLAAKSSFGKDFYDVFFHRCPAAREYFGDIDLSRQAILVTMSLLVIVKHYDQNYSATSEYLRYLGTKHHDRRIPKELYTEWSAAMLETLARFHGPQWTTELSEEWRTAIEQVTNLMFQGYDVHFTV
jgi:hemoglobin-like flavoprotein